MRQQKVDVDQFSKGLFEQGIFDAILLVLFDMQFQTTCDIAMISLWFSCNEGRLHNLAQRTCKTGTLGSGLTAETITITSPRDLCKVPAIITQHRKQFSNKSKKYLLQRWLIFKIPFRTFSCLGATWMALLKTVTAWRKKKDTIENKHETVHRWHREMMTNRRMLPHQISLELVRLLLYEQKLSPILYQSNI